jgi:hypothetical protein
VREVIKERIVCNTAALATPSTHHLGWRRLPMLLLAPQELLVGGYDDHPGTAVSRHLT